MLTAQRRVWRAVCSVRPRTAQLLGAVLCAPGGTGRARTAGEGEVQRAFGCCLIGLLMLYQTLRSSAWHIYVEA